MDRRELEQEVIRIVRKEKDLPPDVDPNVSLAEVGIDSLDSLTILFALEEHFKIAIPDEKARAIASLSDMVRVIEELTAPAHG